MARFMLTHRHEPGECRVAFAAWRGFESPLRHEAALSTCEAPDGTAEHAIWWEVEATDVDTALAQLPPYIAERTTAVSVREVAIP